MPVLEELQEIADRLLNQARTLPPGADRNSALKDVGKLRERLDVLKRQHNQDRAKATSRSE